MRAVVRILARERGGRRQETRVAAHHHGAVDAVQRDVVEIYAGEGLDDEPRRRRISGHVIEADEVVVDRLGDVDRPERMTALPGLVGDNAHGVGGIVAADIEERVDRVRLQDLEDLLAVLEVGLVAGRAERGGGSRGDRFKVADRFLAEIDEVVVDDASHAMQRAVDFRDARKAAGLERDADQGLVDHRRRSAALSDQNLVRHGYPPCSASPRAKPPGDRQALGAESVMRKTGARFASRRGAGPAAELDGVAWADF